MSSNNEYAIYHGSYLVRILNDNSQRGYKIKVRFVTTDLEGALKETSATRWVKPEQLDKLTKEVVDIMVASGSV